MWLVPSSSTTQHFCGGLVRELGSSLCGNHGDTRAHKPTAAAPYTQICGLIVSLEIITLILQWCMCIYVCSVMPEYVMLCTCVCIFCVFMTPQFTSCRAVWFILWAHQEVSTDGGAPGKRGQWCCYGSCDLQPVGDKVCGAKLEILHPIPAVADVSCWGHVLDTSTNFEYCKLLGNSLIVFSDWICVEGCGLGGTFVHI